MKKRSFVIGVCIIGVVVYFLLAAVEGRLVVALWNENVRYVWLMVEVIIILCCLVSIDL